MRFSRSIRLVFFIFMVSGLACLSLFSGCRPDECTPSRLPWMQVQIIDRYKANPLATRFTYSDTTYKAIFRLPVNDTLKLSDRLPYGYAPGFWAFPLDNNTDSTVVLFSRSPYFPVHDPALLDTLVLAYNRDTYFRSQACGFAMRFKNLSVKRDQAWSDSIAAPLPLVDTVQHIHLRLYIDK